MNELEKFRTCLTCLQSRDNSWTLFSSSKITKESVTNFENMKVAKPLKLGNLFMIYKEHMVNGRMKQPMIVFCTTDTHVRVFADHFRDLGRKIAPNTDAHMRITQLCANNQNTSWDKAFFEDPNNPAILHADVLLFTHCVPAGISLECHYTAAVYLFPNTGCLKHRNEFQFGRRLRWRYDLWPYITGYMDKGKPGSRYTSSLGLLRLYAQISELERTGNNLKDGLFPIYFIFKCIVGVVIRIIRIIVIAFIQVVI
jgi:hypothetical protein